MFERILVPLDGSERAEAVLPTVTGLARGTGSQILLFRAYSAGLGAGFEYSALTLEFRLGAEEYLKGVKERLRAEGVAAETRTLLGDPAWTILELAEREEASLVALATHGRTGISRWVFGSVTEKVLRASTKPLLIAHSFPTPAKEHQPWREYRLILVPVDGSELARQVVPHVTEIARRFDSTVLVMTVIDHESARDPIESLQGVTAALAAEGVEGRFLVRRGDPAAQILDVAREAGADLIAMTTHGRSGPSRWVMGSVTEKVVRASPAPLLVVRNGPVPKVLAGLASAQERV